MFTMISTTLRSCAAANVSIAGTGGTLSRSTTACLTRYFMTLISSAPRRWRQARLFDRCAAPLMTLSEQGRGRYESPSNRIRAQIQKPGSQAHGWAEGGDIVSDLKPCGCGSRYLSLNGRRVRPDYDVHHVSCPKCGSQTAEFETVFEAKVAWNTRPANREGET